jgi:hypothetical protein
MKNRLEARQAICSAVDPGMTQSGYLVAALEALGLLKFEADDSIEAINARYKRTTEAERDEVREVKAGFEIVRFALAVVDDGTVVCALS